MKIIDGFTLRNVAGEMIISGESVAQINFNKLIALNESAAYLWQQVEGKEFTVDTLSELLVAEYEIDAQRAQKDAAAVLKSWMDVGIVE